MPHISPDEIRDEIAAARIASVRDERPSDGSLDDLDLEDPGLEGEPVEEEEDVELPVPTPEEMVAGWGRIATRLTAPRPDGL